MKFVKRISYFFVYPLLVLCLGIFLGVQGMQFFYPGGMEQAQEEQEEIDLQEKEAIPAASASPEPDTEAVSSQGETLCVDTEYVLEETDVLRQTVVETVWKLPGKYVGMNREQFLEAMELYEAYPPLSELERGFIGLDVLSFSRERVIIQMNYQYLQPSESFYLAVQDHEVVVYLEDQKTIYINTGIRLENLPESLQIAIMNMMWVEDEESLYDFLETYSS